MKTRFLPRPLYAPANDSGGGSDKEPQGTPEEPEKDAPDDPAPEPEDKGGDPLDGLTPAQQARVNELVGSARTEGRQKGQAAKEKEIEAAKKKEQGKFEDLYKEKASRVEELEPKAERADRLSEHLNSQINEQVSDWPDRLTKTDPGPDDVEARLEWVDTWEEVAEDLKEPPKAPDTESGGGNRPTPTPAMNGEADNNANFRFQEEGDVSW